MRDAADCLAGHDHDLVLAQEASETALDAEDLPSAIQRRDNGGADDGVQAGGATAAGRNGDAHLCACLCRQMRSEGNTGLRPHRSDGAAACSSPTISPGIACLPSFDFSKIGCPSRETSNRPPPEG